MALSVVLLFLTKWPWIFAGVYFLDGLTDVLDGRLARRFRVESSLGAKLDGIGDAMLFIAALVSVCFLARLEIELVKCLAALSLGLVHKAANFLLGRVRFKTWNSMHTLMNKSVGVVIFFFVPVFLILGKVNFYMVLTIGILIWLACLEETVTLMKLKEFDVDCKGILGEKLAARLPRRKAA